MKPPVRVGPGAEEAEILGMISEGSPPPPPETAAERARRRWPRREPASVARDDDRDRNSRPGWFGRKLNRVSENLGRKYLELLGRDGRMSDTVRSVPKRMRKVANQT
ncbi:MAG TPA: hypothetical protein VFU02_04145, partial [Polyangiaceae bacterium]|nr:hypothetical protein [Polyangiaceae bacterium]